MAEPTKTNTTEENILAAAKRVFIRKGYAGARMQEVADEAGINKAMLHYYFRSKDKLFQVILAEATATVSGLLYRHLGSDAPLFDKLEELTREYVQLLIDNPHLPLFVMNELSQNRGEFIRSALDERKAAGMLKFFQQVAEEAQAGTIRPVAPLHLVFHLMGMIIFPFIAGPIIKQGTGMDDEAYDFFMGQRAEEIMVAMRRYLAP